LTRVRSLACSALRDTRKTQNNVRQYFQEAAMKSLLVSVALGAGFLLSGGAYADAPAGSTAQCKDGTYYSGTTHKGACRGHQGVKEWLDGTAATPAAAPASDAAAAPASTTASKKSKSNKTTDTTAATPATATPPAATPATPAKPAAPATPTTPAAPAAPAVAPAPAAPAMAAKHTAPTPASQITQKAGGGPDQVWVNSSSKVYHCQGDEWYGKTKEGSYMTVAQAEAAGNHAAHGKACAK